RKAAIVADLKDSLRSGGGLVQALCVLESRRHGLLAKHMLAGGYSGERHVDMCGVRRHDIDGVGLRYEVIDASDGECARAGRVYVVNARYAHTVVPFQVRAMNARHESGADKTNLQTH